MPNEQHEVAVQCQTRLHDLMLALQASPGIRAAGVQQGAGEHQGDTQRVLGVSEVRTSVLAGQSIWQCNAETV